MSEQELKAIMHQLKRSNAASREALSILEDIAANLHQNPDALAILFELKRFLVMMESIHFQYLKRQEQQ